MEHNLSESMNRRQEIPSQINTPFVPTLKHDLYLQGATEYSAWRMFCFLGGNAVLSAPFEHACIHTPHHLGFIHRIWSLELTCNHIWSVETVYPVVSPLWEQTALHKCISPRVLPGFKLKLEMESNEMTLLSGIRQLLLWMF